MNGNANVEANEITPPVHGEEGRVRGSVQASGTVPDNRSLDTSRTAEQGMLPEKRNGNSPLSNPEVLPQIPYNATEQHSTNRLESSVPTQDPVLHLNALSTPHHLGSLPLPSLGNIALISFLVVLAYAGASFISLIIASAGVYYLWADWQRREANRRRDPEEDREKVKGKVPIQLAMAEESTEWL